MTEANAAALSTVGIDPDAGDIPALIADLCLDPDTDWTPHEVRQLASERFIRSIEAGASHASHGRHWDAYIAAAVIDEETEPYR